jgi:hypothetical protein
MNNGDRKIEIRPFAWHDLWMLYRFRGQVQFLDNALATTRGSAVGWSAMFGHLHPTQTIFTGVLRSKRDGIRLVGQMCYRSGDHSARLAFILPEREMTSPGAVALVEALAYEAGDRGAMHLLAEVEEGSHTFEALRRAGFSVYGWQRIWRFTAENMPAECAEQCWQPASELDEVAIRSLYHTVAPPIVQGAEPLNGRMLTGLVHLQKGEVLAYAEGLHGPGGIYLAPLVHPNVSDLPLVMQSLLRRLSPRATRPVYVAVRSYQSWIEAALESLGGEPGPRQALMIKHMVQMQRQSLPVARPAVMDNRQAALAGPKADSLRLVLPEETPVARPPAGSTS